MKRILGAALILLGAGAMGRTAPAETTPASLSELFKPGVIFQDTNGDGAIDFVDARLVLPDQPDAAELAAASNIAARLGFETSAMNIPVARADRAASEEREAVSRATRAQRSSSARSRSPPPR